MRDINKLDTIGISNLGIEFETNEEMREFAEIIREDLEVNVGRAISKTVPPEQMDELEKITESHEIVKWLEANCPQYREICQKVRIDIKKELLKYKDDIPGIRTSPSMSWNGRQLDECDGLSIGDIKMLKMKGIETLGELYSLDRFEICELLEVPLREARRADIIMGMLEESRWQAGLDPIEDDFCDEWMDDYETFYDEEFLISDYPDEGEYEFDETRKTVSNLKRKGVSDG